jgi:hypothetical protein
VHAKTILSLLSLSLSLSLSLLSTALRVVFLRLASLSLSSGGLAGRSGRERDGQLPCTVCRCMFLGLAPLLGVSPRRLGGALDLGAQIRSVLGYLLVVALLLWPERARRADSSLFRISLGLLASSRCRSRRFFSWPAMEVGGKVCCRSFTSGRPWRRGGVEALGGFFCIVVVVLRLRVSAIFSSVRPWWCGRRWSAHSALWRFE